MDEVIRKLAKKQDEIDVKNATSDPRGEVTIAGLQEALQRIEDARRVILCPPHMRERVEAAVNSFEFGGALFRVLVTPHTPDDKIYLLKPMMTGYEFEYKHPQLSAEATLYTSEDHPRTMGIDYNEQAP